MKARTSYLFLSLVSLAGITSAVLFGGCVSSPEDDHLDVTEAALTADECNYFEVGGKARICHATGSADHPYVILQISDSACINAHVAHAGDYIATPTDQNCQGGGCMPEGAPADPNIPCCPCTTNQNGVCTAVTCAASDQCHVAGSCDFSTGQCSNPAASDGASCDIGTCQGGVCTSSSNGCGSRTCQDLGTYIQNTYSGGGVCWQGMAFPDECPGDATVAGCGCAALGGTCSGSACIIAGATYNCRFQPCF